MREGKRLSRASLKMSRSDKGVGPGPVSRGHFSVKGGSPACCVKVKAWVPSSLTLSLRTRPRLLKPGLGCLRASNYDGRPSGTEVRQVSNLLWGRTTRCPAPQPPAAPENAAASFRDPPPFRSAACRPPPGNPGFRGQRKEIILLGTGSRFGQQ